MRNDEILIQAVTNIVNKILDEREISKSMWHYGLVVGVNDGGTLDVKIDGSDTVTKRVRCNPDVAFRVTDRVIILYVNNKSSNAFVLSRR